MLGMGSSPSSHFSRTCRANASASPTSCRLAGAGDRALPLRAVQIKDEFDLQIALDPFKDLGFDMGAIPCRGTGFGPEFHAAELDALSIQQVAQRHAQRLRKRRSTPELGMSSPRSYLPIAWAVTLSSIAADSPRKRKAGLTPGKLHPVGNHCAPPSSLHLIYYRM